MRLFELTPTRSIRVTWTLAELQIPYESVTGEGVFQNPDLKKVHPLGKLPALEVDGKGLFESAAICTYLADSVPNKKFVAPAGSWERALHDQWVCFALTEMEAWLWSSFRNQVILPEEQQVPQIHEQNRSCYREGASALDEALGKNAYLVADSFSVTDIIVGFTCQFGENQGHNDGFDNINAYLERLKTREHCTLG